jgi:hypothetical protein
MDNWCIKLTEENKEAVAYYLENKFKCQVLGNYLYYGCKDDLFKSSDNSFEKEITFDEFKQMVEFDSPFLQGLKNDTKGGVSERTESKFITDLEALNKRVENKSVFHETLSNLADLLKYKNEKYGNSVLDPLEIFKGKCKAGERLDDKLSRIKNSDVLRKNDITDLIGYLVLTCVENGWDSFDEFKD